MKFKLFTLKNSYIFVFLSLVFWAAFAYHTMSDLIENQKVYAKLINVSGKQRMLSQKTTLIAKRIYETKEQELIDHFHILKRQMIEDHRFLTNNLPSEKLKNLYFELPIQLDSKVEKYFALLEQFIHNMDNTAIIKEIENYSFALLPKLDQAVNEFEKESMQKTQKLQSQELFIFTGTLLTIIFEALFIILPMMRETQKKQRDLEALNLTLEDEVLQKLNETRKRDKLIAEQTKLAAMGEMIGNIAHQWRQPLSVISTAATGLKAKNDYGLIGQDDINNSCEMINENAQFLSHTIEEFRKYVKGDSKPIRFDLKNDTDSFVKLVDGTIKQYHLHIILNLNEDIKVKGYPHELIQCFINIFNNAKDALVANNSENDRFIFISQEIKNKQVIIIFKDNAGGIPEDIIDKIYEPYFSTKHKSQGTGLGLHMAYNLITNSMNGSIEVENETYQFNNKEYTGAKVTITIPLS